MTTDRDKDAYIEQLEHHVTQLSKELARVKEIVALLTKNVYGKSKETLIPANQLNLFEENHPKKTEDSKGTMQVIKSYRRKKRRGRKQAILDQFPQENIYHELNPAQQTCQDCHHPLKQIGATLVHRALKFIPAVLCCQNHYQTSYKCECCSKEALTDCFKKAPVPAAPIPNSFGSPSVIAETIYQKYELKVPAYRQEAHWRQFKLPLSRTSICRWHIQVCEAFLARIYHALHDTLIQQDIVHADETTFRVLESDKTTTYYWLLQSSKHHECPIVYYAHRDGRGGGMFDSVIEDFKGFMHCDMYTVYRQVSEVNAHIQLVGCWAHLRRKFFEAYSATPAGSASMEATLIEMIDQLFEKEREWAHLTSQERYQKRQRSLKSRMHRLFELIDQAASFVVKGSLFGKAVHYALNHRQHFYAILKDGRLELSNNAAERSIKTLVMGRKNQLFTQSFAGAQAGAILLTLIETAKRHGLQAKAYLEYLLTHLPNVPALATADLTAYMPWSDAVKTSCQLTPIQTHLS